MADLPPGTTAVAASAQMGAGTTHGHFCVIGEDVRIGEGCRIGHHVVIHEGALIGDGVRIDDHTTIGKQPMQALNSAVTDSRKQPPARIGSNALIGASVVIYAGCELGEGVLVADLATIREEVEVGAFTIIGRGVAVENKCRIGRYCKLETNAYLAAHSVLENRVFVAPGVVTSNDRFIGRTPERLAQFKGVTVRKGGRLGAGAIILPGKEVAPDSVVAAGAVLTRDTDGAVVYTGIPARPLRPVSEEQLLKNQGWPE